VNAQLQAPACIREVLSSWFWCKQSLNRIGVSLSGQLKHQSVSVCGELFSVCGELFSVSGKVSFGAHSLVEVATTDAVTEEISPADTSDSGVPEQNSGPRRVGSVTPEFCSGTPESLVSAGLISSVTASVVATGASTGTEPPSRQSYRAGISWASLRATLSWAYIPWIFAQPFTTATSNACRRTESLRLL
jgi:hypothetical protein